MGFRLRRTKTDNRNKDTKIQYKVHIFGHLNLNQHNILFLIGISLVSGLSIRLGQVPFGIYVRLLKYFDC